MKKNLNLNNKLISEEMFPDGEEIFGWIKDLTQWGHRKTGTVEGQKSADYIASKMNEFGLEDIMIEKVPSMCMNVAEHILEIDGEQFENFYINGSNRFAEAGEFVIGDEATRDEIIYVGDGTVEDFNLIDVSGKIVVCDLRFLKSDASHVLNWNKKAEVYDPKEKMKKDYRKYDIYSPNPANWPYNYFRALKKNAKGFVGILNDYSDDPYWYCEDYTEIGNKFGIKYMSLPGCFISRSSGNRLKMKFAENRNLLSGKMKMTTTYEYKDALNISGRLSGKSSDIILVHSHHDAVFQGAVQDASGISEMLALAKYFSRLPQEAREKTMMFAAMDTHYTDYMGHQGFIKQRELTGDHILLDIAIEHIGKEVELSEDYRFIETGEIENRLVYITNINSLLDVVKNIFKKYDLQKTIFFPVNQMIKQNQAGYEFQQDEIISDSYYFAEAGIPVVSMVAGEMYIFHPSDTIERIPLDELKPVGMAFAEIAIAAANMF